jgi:hypothetical protein
MIGVETVEIFGRDEYMLCQHRGRHMSTVQDFASQRDNPPTIFLGKICHHGGLGIEPGHFTGWSLGARFYPILYLLTRMGDSRDWGTGLPLKNDLLGKMSKLEVHHIFPKARLYNLKYTRPEVNALANFCFQTKQTNLEISDRLPEEYFPVFEAKHPGWSCLPVDSQ